MVSAISPLNSDTTKSTTTSGSKPTKTAHRPPPLMLYSEIPITAYKIERELGAGKTSFVLGVLTPRRTKEYAMKIPFQKYSLSTEKEARMLESLKDVPHTVRFINDFNLAPVCYKSFNKNLCLGCTKDDRLPRHAILTDLIPGKNAFAMYLEGLRESELPNLSISQILSIAKQGLETLASLEMKKIAHRDLKPENISYDPSTGQLFILDFGYASLVNKTIQGKISGTLNYISPEQLLGNPFTTNCDVWAWAATLFELYTGEQLFPSAEYISLRQDFTDLWHMIIAHIGKPPIKFVESSNPGFEFFENGSLIGEASEETNQMLERCKELGQCYPELPIWQVRLVLTATKKEEDISKLIDLLTPMLCYEKRILASTSLKTLAHEKSSEEKN